MNDNTKLQLIQELAKGNVKIGQLIMEVHGDNHFHEAENKTHTENTAMSRNPWMKYPIDSWEENGASERALRLRDALMEQVEMLLIAIPQKDIGAEEC